MARPSRWKALVLLVALLSGGFGLPLFDAIAFHSRPAPARPDTSILAAPGADVGHAPVCALSHARTPTSCGPEIPAALADPFLRTIRAKVHSAPIILEHVTSYEHHSRAPPALA